MQHTESLNELFAALAKAQGQMTHAKKDTSNPFFKSKYADLASVWEACGKALQDNDLSVAQVPDTVDGKPALTTILGHKSGQWIKGTMVLPIAKPGAQEIGSCVSYIRRYCLASMVGCYQDDDDGEAAQKPHREADKPKSIPKINDDQCTEIEEWLKSYPEKRDGLMKKFNVKNVSELPSVYFEGIVKTFHSMEKQKEGA